MRIKKCFENKHYVYCVIIAKNYETIIMCLDTKKLISSEKCENNMFETLKESSHKINLNKRFDFHDDHDDINIFIRLYNGNDSKHYVINNCNEEIEIFDEKTMLKHIKYNSDITINSLIKYGHIGRINFDNIGIFPKITYEIEQANNEICYMINNNFYFSYSRIDEIIKSVCSHSSEKNLKYIKIKKDKLIIVIKNEIIIYDLKKEMILEYIDTIKYFGNIMNDIYFFYEINENNYFIIFELKDIKYLNNSFTKISMKNDLLVYCTISKCMLVNNLDDVLFNFE